MPLSRGTEHCRGLPGDSGTDCTKIRTKIAHGIFAGCTRVILLGMRCPASLIVPHPSTDLPRRAGRLSRSLPARSSTPPRTSAFPTPTSSPMLNKNQNAPGPESGGVLVHFLSCGSFTRARVTAVHPHSCGESNRRVLPCRNSSVKIFKGRYSKVDVVDQQFSQGLT